MFNVQKNVSDVNDEKSFRITDKKISYLGYTFISSRSLKSLCIKKNDATVLQVKLGELLTITTYHNPSDGRVLNGELFSIHKFLLREFSLDLVDLLLPSVGASNRFMIAYGLAIPYGDLKIPVVLYCDGYNFSSSDLMMSFALESSVKPLSKLYNSLVIGNSEEKAVGYFFEESLNELDISNAIWSSSNQRHGINHKDYICEEISEIQLGKQKCLMKFEVDNEKILGLVVFNNFYLSSKFDQKDLSAVSAMPSEILGAGFLLRKGLAAYHDNKETFDDKKFKFSV